MARREQDREDLMREAVRLVPRGRWRLPAGAPCSEVVLGLRSDALSIYFDADPVYHFNQEGELRRAYVGGQLWKARRGQIVLLRRDRRPDRVELRSCALSQPESAEAAKRVGRELAWLLEALEQGEAVCEAVVPQSASAQEQLIEALRRVASGCRIAASPHVGKP